jgi:hypothetical protein
MRWDRTTKKPASLEAGSILVAISLKLKLITVMFRLKGSFFGNAKVF